MPAWENNSKWLCYELKQIRWVIATCECTLNVLWVFEELKSMLPFFVTQICSAAEPIMANTNAMWQQAVHITTNYHFLAAQQKPYKRA